MWFCCFCATVLIEKKDIYFPLHRKAPDRSKTFPFFGVLLAESLSIILTPMSSHSKMSFSVGRKDGREDSHPFTQEFGHRWMTDNPSFLASFPLDTLWLFLSPPLLWELWMLTSLRCGDKLYEIAQTLCSVNSWHGDGYRGEWSLEQNYCTRAHFFTLVCVCVWMRILLSFKYIFITCRRLMCWSCEHLQKENNSYSIRTIHASSQICAEGSQTFNNNAEFIILLIFCPIIHFIIILFLHFCSVTLIVSLNNLFLPSLGAGNIAPHSERKRGDTERKAL